MSTPKKKLTLEETLDEEAAAKQKPPASVLPLTRREGIERFAGGFALAAAFALAFFGARSQGWFGTTPTAMPPHGTPADELRDQAFKECGRTHWQKCLDLLDAAKKEDYPGDFEPEVVNARMLAERELAKDGG